MVVACASPLRAQDTNLEQQVRALQQENSVLEQQLDKQNASLESLTKKVQELEATNSERENAESENAAAPPSTGYNFGNVNISAEGGVAFFNTEAQGFDPNAQFRVDEGRLFVEAPIWKEVYFQGEADLATREYTEDYSVQAGEVYLDFQDASQLWGQDNQLNIRAGRIYIPFGEEYLMRYAIDDPLISHSVTDIWGYDTGVEAYGALGNFNYVVAVQNVSGAYGTLDLDGDKSVAGRIGFDPNRHWHFSVSAMRTGNLSVQNDFISAIWFGNGFFQSLGGPETTRFHVNLLEGDATARWASGHVTAFGGYGRYGDNDPAADNGRNIFYYSVEAVQDLPAKFYAAARLSEVICDQGLPVVGLGNPYDYFSVLNKDLWRLSLGLGYRFSDRLELKMEYSFEDGRDIDGQSRDHEDFFGTEAAFKF